ncbi:MAG: MoxR family ATPase [Betaproteobacteria bacterium]|nr:MoxR family ATPase [Betaproteobacteria bacterium]
MTSTIPADKIAQAADVLSRMRAEIGRAMVGQQEVVEHALAALLAGGHVLIEGVPGLGKTLLVRAMAKTFDARFARIQFTPDLMPADVTGHTLYDQASGQFVARRGPVFTNLLLADEINRAPAKTQSALLEVMQEGQVTLEGTPHRLDPPFMVLATQNPIEQEGTYALPEAQLDRFLLKLRIGYPPLEEEFDMVRRVTTGQIGDKLNVDAVQTLIKPEVLLALQRIAAAISIDDQVLDYAIRIARATRTWNGVAIGAGPRAGIALVRAARSAALIAGRDYVTPDDIKRIALPCLRHRVTPAPELEIEGQSSDSLIAALLQQVEAPRS